ncbi:MAG: hypothetical protein NXH97_16260 [Rhodobacteraceae bacterium]|nr:hypothetical protein [Paracoccaceae bacterium]
MVTPVRAGRSVESLALEYELCAPPMHEWVGQSATDYGDNPRDPTTKERDELRQRRREVKQLRQARDILSKGLSVKAPSVQAQWATAFQRHIHFRAGILPLEIAKLRELCSAPPSLGHPDGPD